MNRRLTGVLIATAVLLTTGLSTGNDITIHLGDELCHLIDCKAKAIGILKDTCYITEDDSRFWEVRNAYDVVFNFLHSALLSKNSPSVLNRKGLTKHMKCEKNSQHNQMFHIRKKQKASNHESKRAKEEEKRQNRG